MNDSGPTKGRFVAGKVVRNVVPNSWNLISIPSYKLTTVRQMKREADIIAVWSYNKDSDNLGWQYNPTFLHGRRGYWVRVGEVYDDKFPEILTTDFEALDVNSSTSIKKYSSDKWELLGTGDENLSWESGYSEVRDGCSKVQIYYYDANNSISEYPWNHSKNIPANSGVWVRQIGCH